MRSPMPVLAGLFTALATMAAVQAQPYPARPVRLIVSSTPGGVTDTTARAITGELQAAFGQPIVVENRGGANGNIGGEACAKAAPDGYSACLLNGVAVTFNPFAYAKMPFDVDRDLAPVIHAGFLDIALTVHANLPINSVRELVDYSKAHPGQLNWGSLGIGSNAHMYQVWLQSKTGAQFTHVPYKGAPALFLAANAGEAHVTTGTPGTAQQSVKAGKMRIIGVVTSGKRSPLAPEVPTLKEQGYDLDFRNWNGLFFQRAVAAEIVRRWNMEVNRLLADNRFQERYLAPLAVTAAGGSPEEFMAFIQRDRVTAQELVRLANLKLQE